MTFTDDASGEYQLLAQGWDTVAETYDLQIPEALEEQLEQCRLVAEELYDRENPAPHTIQFGGEEIQINPRRPKRGKWSLQNDDFQITFRSPRMNWCCTVRYSAAGLWEYGIDALRERALGMLLRECRQKGSDPFDWQRISEAHWAFDFYVPAMSTEMIPGILGNVICHSSTKKNNETKLSVGEWGRADYVETLDIGKGAPLHIQLYDKGKEITEASGKIWMASLWERSGWRAEEQGRIRDVWRLEIRMKKDFLRGRGILHLEELRGGLGELLAEALVTRRLTLPNGDKNRARWPLHPMWTAAYRASGEAREMLPLGKQLTEAGDVLRDRLVANVAGNLRTAVVLEVGDYDPENARQILNEALEHLEADPDHDRKTDKAREIYKYVDCAR